MSRERERIDEIGKRLKTEFDASISQKAGRRQMLGPPGTLNTITPCAACKLLRRRCAEECPFSPYFSPHEPQKFAAVHKVFGASNVSKMLQEVPESQRADAANSLVYEANVRLRDPVYGCMGAISALQQQVQNLQAELHVTRNEILRYKYRDLAAANNNTLINPSSMLNSNTNAHVVSIAELGPQAPATPTAAAPPPAPSPPPPPQPRAAATQPPPSVVVVVSAPSGGSADQSNMYTMASNNLPFFD